MREKCHKVTKSQRFTKNLGETLCLRVLVAIIFKEIQTII